jgi:hypothetical protein
MRIGLDLDGTVYQYPEFFRDLIESFHAMGHEFFCTSSHCELLELTRTRLAPT